MPIWHWVEAAEDQRKKHKIHDCGWKRTISDVRQIVTFGEKNFEVVNEFVYLGALDTEERRGFGAFAACENNCGHLTWHVRHSWSCCTAVKRGS
jgi:hypothetical protein